MGSTIKLKNEQKLYEHIIMFQLNRQLHMLSTSLPMTYQYIYILLSNNSRNDKEQISSIKKTVLNPHITLWLANPKDESNSNLQESYLLFYSLGFLSI